MSNINDRELPNALTEKLNIIKISKEDVVNFIQKSYGDFSKPFLKWLEKGNNSEVVSFKDLQYIIDIYNNPEINNNTLKPKQVQIIRTICPQVSIESLNDLYNEVEDFKITQKIKSLRENGTNPNNLKIK